MISPTKTLSGQSDTRAKTPCLDSRGSGQGQPGKSSNDLLILLMGLRRTGVQILRHVRVVLVISEHKLIKTDSICEEIGIYYKLFIETMQRLDSLKLIEKHINYCQNKPSIYSLKPRAEKIFSQLSDGFDHKALTAQIKKIEEVGDIQSLSQALALVTVGSTKEISSHRLTKLIGCDTGTTSNITIKLAKRGFITKRTEPGPRHGTPYYAPTDKLLALLEMEVPA